MAMDSTITIGCDLGDKTTHICALDGRGEVTLRERIRTGPEDVARFFAQLPRALVVLEVGTHSRWFSETARKFGHEVIVANARQLALIYKSRSKTDRKDAEHLARLGRVDRRLLAPIQHRSEKSHAHLAMLRCRDGLVRGRTRLINSARGVIKPFGIRFPQCESESFHKKVRGLVPPSLQGALVPLLASIEQMTSEIRSLDREIEKLASDIYPDAAHLRQIPGVGPITSLAFVLTLEDKTRFRKSRDVGGFLGLVPRKSQTGESDPELGITKAGDPFVRRLLVGCAQYILGPFGPDTDLRRHGLALSNRGGQVAKKRAVVATARKLAVLLHRLWVTGEVYEPLGYGKQSRSRDVSIPAAA